ncbi:hypothetical protein [Nakamurella sp. PAMC28650]|uniref:hypothetical protein n=1 Tax=Nakamurella sp. PAMC28650 TaxID=2762325 RepID=UPI00164D38FE|nr:hypothetical protein [Nakamurella sp. PAMC28650]QNK82598.1 hypothetical protein H7F38_07790 [Nakamurella sp. PAMC28650]
MAEVEAPIIDSAEQVVKPETMLFYFPQYELSVEAVDYDDALKQVKKLAQKDN